MAQSNPQPPPGRPPICLPGHPLARATLSGCGGPWHGSCWQCRAWNTLFFIFKKRNPFSK